MQAEESVQHVKLKNPKNRPVLNDQTQKYSSRQCSEKRRNCGGSWPHEGGQRNCPAFQKQCKNYGKLSHFASMCRSSPQSNPRASQHKQSKQQPRSYNISELDMNKTSLNSSSDEESESDAAFVYATNVNTDKLPHFVVFIQGKNSMFLPTQEPQ